MTEENNTRTYGAVGSTQPADDDNLEGRVRSVSSFYEDETVAAKDERTTSSVVAEKAQLRDEEQEGKPIKESPLSSDDQNRLNNDTRATEKLPRPTRVSFTNEQPTNPAHGAVSPISARHVSFIQEINENEAHDPSVACDNRGFSDMQSSSDSLTRVRAITNCSVHYQTHSEGEECNESEISLAWNFQQNSQTTPRRRRRYSTRHGTMVSDSFVNECICCCVIF